MAITIFYLLAWLPASLAKKKAYGKKWLVSNRDDVPSQALSIVGDRANRAYKNLQYYYPAFIATVMLVISLEVDDEVTAIASIIYVVSRVIHFPCYCFGFARARILAWFLGLVSNIWLLIYVVYQLR